MKCKCEQYGNYSELIVNINQGIGTAYIKQEGKRVPEHEWDLSCKHKCYCWMCSRCKVHCVGEIK